MAEKIWTVLYIHRCKRMVSIFHYYHQITLTAQNSMTPFCHSPQSSIFLGRSSWLHLVSAQSWCKKAFAGQQILAHPCARVHKKILLMSSSLLFQLCFTCLICLLDWFLRLEASGYTAAVLWGVAFRICSRQHVAFLYTSHLAFSICFANVHLAHPYSRMDIAAA